MLLPDQITASYPAEVAAALQITPFDTEASWRSMMPASRRLYEANAATPPSPAAVLLLLYPESGEWHLVLTRRSSQLRGHSGQISFPGGRIDAADASAQEAALRETREELGIATDEIVLLGQLRKVYIPPTHYEVTPFVGGMPKVGDWRPNPDEVAEVLSLSLLDLLDERRRGVSERIVRGHAIRIPYYDVVGHQVWGATALMLSELEGRLRQFLRQPASPR